MEIIKDEISFEFPPFIRVYKDGRAERLVTPEFTPPSVDPSTGVSSKDVTIDEDTALSARLYLPKLANSSDNKLPLLIYFHGGGFLIESAFSPTYHRYLNSLVAEANVVAVSVDYRKAPEHFLPVAFEDSWTAIQWVVSQFQQEEWLSKYADFDSVFMAGDSAGATIAHNMAIRIGKCYESGAELKMKIDGIVLIHPFFAGAEPIGSEVGNQSMETSKKLIWQAIYPSTTGLDDPLVNPAKDLNLSKMGCRRILVFVAENDSLRDRGKFYCEEVGKSEWEGVVEFMETQGENHVFHLLNPETHKAKDVMNRVVSFITTAS